MNDKDKRAEELFKGVLDDSHRVSTGAIDTSKRDDVDELVARMNPVPPRPKPDTDD